MHFGKMAHMGAALPAASKQGKRSAGLLVKGGACPGDHLDICQQRKQVFHLITMGCAVGQALGWG